jgi:hypothetical protein
MARARQATLSTRFVVHRLNWRYNGRWHLQPGMLRVCAFDSRAEAEADSARREANARRRVNPFAHSALSALSSMPEGVFLDLAADLGAAPPGEKKGKLDWEAWWPALRDEQRTGLYQAMDLLRYYSVVERPAVPVAYCVMGVNEFYNGEHWEIVCEGGAIAGVWRAPAKALERARRWHASHRVNPSYWFPSSVDPFDPESHYRRFIEGPWDADVVEIELHETAKKASKCHVVARRTWERRNYLNRPHDEERVPVAAFTNRGAAEARRDELESEAWRHFDVLELFRGDSDDNDEGFAAAVRAAVEQAGLGCGAEGVTSLLEKHKGELSAEQRAAIVRGVPRWRIHDIVEAEFRD